MSKLKMLLLLLLIGMMGCTKSNVEIKTTEHIVGDEINPLQEIKIEECQYFYGNWGNATVLTHKGNCNNPIHQHNGGNNE